ncbi:hypothetical protein C8R44DRAFT_972655 [Mycena epipterygia]|nr:hypothetical protein C8R44DRAFT_972655 [Mycena epipterygia]
MGVPHLAPGKCSVRMVYRRSSPNNMSNNMEIAVLEINHSESVVNISEAFSKNWTAPDLQALAVRDVAVSEKIIAIHGDDVYVIRQPLAELGRIRTSAAPGELKLVTRKLDTPFSVQWIEESFFLSASNPRSPKYGILNVTTRSKYDVNGEAIGSLYFWPAEDTRSPLETINFQPLCFYEHSTNIRNFAVGSSGTCAVIVDEEHTLGLVQYTSHPTTDITLRPLRLPEGKADLRTEIALDDRLGIVYLLHPTEIGTGTFTIISYA